MNLTTWRKKNNAPSNKLLRSKTLQYIDSKDWYLKSNTIIKELYHKDYKLFIKLLAVTSPRNTVKQNTVLAIRSFKYIKANKKIDFSYGIAHTQIKRNVDRVINAEAIGGIKVNSFINCLNLIDNSVCVDIWILRAFNVKRTQTLPNDVVHINSIVQGLSNNLCMSTYEVQACLWSYAKQELNTSKHRAYDDFSLYLRV